MAVTAWKSPGTCESVARSGDSGGQWDNPGRAVSSNNSYATGHLADPSHISDWLRCTNFGFNADDIPENSIVDGIEVDIESKCGYDDSSYIIDSAIYLRKTSGQVGDNKALATHWPLTDEYRTHGGETDDWNAGLLDTDIRGANFGIDISTENGGGLPYSYIDHVRIRIYYTPNPFIIYGSNPDAYIMKDATSYASTHDAESGDTVYPSGDNLSIKQWHAEPYSIRRGYLFFDVPEIPGFIVSAKIVCRCAYKYTTGGSGFDLVVQNGQPTYPHNPVVVGDYNCANYSGDGGSINEADITADTDFEIPLNNDGLGWITPGAINKFCLRLSTDIASNPPYSGTQEIAIRSADYATVAERPRLVITWASTSITEGVRAGDDFATDMVLGANLSEGEKSGDSFGRKIQASKGISEGVKSGDDLAREIEVTKNVADGAKLGEQVDRKIETEKSVAEGVKAGDGFATTANFQEGVSEGTKLGDEIEGDTPYRGAQVDGVELGDAFEGDNSNRGELYEGSKLGDTIDVTSPIYPTQTEGEKSGDTWFRKVVTRKKTIAEGTKLSDALTGTISNVYLRPQDTVHYLTSDSPILEQIITSGVGILDAELPALTCYARGGARLIADLPTLTLVATAVGGNAGLLDATLPALVCEAMGYPANVGTVDADLPVFTLYARGSYGGRFDDYVLRYSRGL